MDLVKTPEKEFTTHLAAYFVGCTRGLVIRPVDIREVAYIELVNKRKIYLRIFYVEMALEIACVFHCQIDLLF